MPRPVVLRGLAGVSCFVTHFPLLAGPAYGVHANRKHTRFITVAEHAVLTVRVEYAIRVIAKAASCGKN